MFILSRRHSCLQWALYNNVYPLGRARYGGGSGSDGESGSSRSHSRSGSESRSLSGHEPDNESSDGGARTPDDDDGSGVYLPHAYAHRPVDVEYMNHGVSYYNTFVGFDRDRQPSPGIHRVSTSYSCFHLNFIPVLSNTSDSGI